MQTFKALYDQQFIESFTIKIAAVYPAFQAHVFAQAVTADPWDDLAFKQRMHRLTQALRSVLPDDYTDALKIIVGVSPVCSGVEYMFLPDYIERHGLADFEPSIMALAALTSSASAEFAVRPFIERYPDKMFAQLLEWSQSPNEHLRRLSSEGCRPLLPWASHLQMLIKDPAPIIPILENLMEDPSEYVRRSAANNLNDIAKHHPTVVKDLTKKWLGRSVATDRLLKHGCRTLLKSADEDILTLFGFPASALLTIENLTATPQVTIGESLVFSLMICSAQLTPQKIRLDYGLTLVKANGKHSEKKFRLADKLVQPGQTVLKKSHSFAPITTRTYYPGEHKLTIYLNGIASASVTFILQRAEMTAFAACTEGASHESG